MTGFDDIDEVIAGLHALSEWRRQHPEIDTSMALPLHCTATAASSQALAAALASEGTVRYRCGHGWVVERQFGGGVTASAFVSSAVESIPEAA